MFLAIFRFLKSKLKNVVYMKDVISVLERGILIVVGVLSKTNVHYVETVEMLPKTPSIGLVIRPDVVRQLLKFCPISYRGLLQEL